MQYFAHSENKHGIKHELSKHLNRTAELAESFASEENYKPIFRMVGFLHDFGKYQPEFQQYLKEGGQRGSVPHAAWGAGYARLCRAIELSIAIDGHHKGLPDNSAWKNDTEPFKRGEALGFENIRQVFIRDAGINETDIRKSDSLTFTDKLQREVFIRYLFSALTDSDWLSTEEHFEQGAFNARIGSFLPIEDMLKKLEGEFSGKPKDGEVNRMRNDARNRVLQMVDVPCGFYSLSLPTGMGKTLTSMTWALRHAKHNDLKRIIIVLPYINIIDQTAQVLKDIFGDKWVLEHHSSYNEEDESIGDALEDCTSLQKRKKLACENWDYPIIVTTTVQFFESLFSRKRSKCRKIHNIAESVVIFDEIQALPKEVILPTLTMLKNIQAVMKTSFLFCTATQPAFEKQEKFDGIENIIPLIADPAMLYEKMRRVDYHLLNGLQTIDRDDLYVAVMQSTGAALVIFNTKKPVLEFYEYAKNRSDWEKIYHLSTAMCPAHRKVIIGNIRHDLEARKKILVISTQLIESGVDFDFPFVFRAMAPLEAVIQSAGRCNREGKLNGCGNVYLFKLADGGMPDKTYAACAGFAEDLIKSDINRLYKHDIFTWYYAQLIKLFVDPDKYGINQAREAFNYETVNGAYRIIRNVTQGLYVYNYSAESRKLLHSLKYKEFLSRDDYRNMQQFTVQVYQKFILDNNQICETSKHGFKVWRGNYDQNTGISVAPVEADKLIV